VAAWKNKSRKMSAAHTSRAKSQVFFLSLRVASTVAPNANNSNVAGSGTTTTEEERGTNIAGE